MSKKFEFKISGVGANAYHDGQLQCNYIYASSNYEHEPEGQPDYAEVLEVERPYNPMMVNYSENPTYGITNEEGVFALAQGGNEFSIFRREYTIYERFNLKNRELETKTYVGPWEPVAIKIDTSYFRDFNITAGRKYQYILIPESVDNRQQFANVTDDPESIYKGTGIPVSTDWNFWSLTELIPVENTTDAPIVKRTYKADINNIWLFKYSLETGDQTQNFSKSDIQNLGQFVKMGYGKQNYISGNVSCLLGSEIVPYTEIGYIERMRGSIRTPLSGNEKIHMLQEWRKIAFSPNPKLLKDIKGQSWIVQIVSNSNTPRNFYKDQPDSISFSWKQIADTENVVIVGSGDSLPDLGACASDWHKI